MNRLKLAELTSGIGALVLGAGLAVLMPRLFEGFGAAITAIGLSLHAFGMWDKHRLEAREGHVDPSWVLALYWVCWLLLGGVVVLLLVRR